MKTGVRWTDRLAVMASLWVPHSAAEPLHTHDAFEIGWCRKGRAVFVGAMRVELEEGDLYLVNDREPHALRADAREPCQILQIHFDPSVLLQEDETLTALFAYYPPTFSHRIAGTSSDAERWRGLLDQLARELNERPAGFRTAAKSLLLQVCVDLYRSQTESRGADAWYRSGSRFSRKRAILTYVEEHYTEPLELSDLARELGLSVDGAGRLFRTALGRSFRDHVNNLRVAHAKRLLVSSAADITKIAFDSGFQSVPTFYRVFHELTQMSPSQFRQRHPGSDQTVP